MNIKFDTRQTEFYPDYETSFIFDGPFLEVSLEKDSDAQLIFEDLIDRRLIEGTEIDKDENSGVKKFLMTLSMIETDDEGSLKPAPLMVSKLRTEFLSTLYTPVDNNPVPENMPIQLVPKQLDESFVNEIVYQYIDYMEQQKELYKKTFYLKDYDQDIEINFSDYLVQKQIIANIKHQVRDSTSFFSLLPLDILKTTFFRHILQPDLKNLVGYHTKNQQVKIHEMLKELFSLEEKNSEPSFIKNMICAEPNRHISRIKAVLEELTTKKCIRFIERRISECRLRVLKTSELPQYIKQEREEQAEAVALNLPAHGNYDSDSDGSNSESDSPPPRRPEENTHTNHYRLEQNMFVITHCNFGALTQYYSEHKDKLEKDFFEEMNDLKP